MQQAPSYEFTPDESARIGKLAWRVKLWGIIALVFGVVALGGLALLYAVVKAAGIELGGLLVPAVVVMIPVALINAIIALLYIGSGNALRRVVDSQHEDVPHLLDGMARLAGAFRIETILGSLGVIASAVTLYAVIGSALM